MCLTNTDNEKTQERKWKNERRFCFNNTPGEAKHEERQKKNLSGQVKEKKICGFEPTTRSLARPLPTASKLGKYASPRDELIVGALLRYLAFMHDEDAVAHAHDG